MENKVKIVKQLEELLKLTRAGEDIFLLAYQKDENGEEFVNIHYKDDYIRKVCVTADSGIAIIHDVLKMI